MNPAATMNPHSSILHTPSFAHCGVAWSPFHTPRFAVATSANYGLVGNGRLNLASVLIPPGPLIPPPPVNLEKTYDTQDGLFDLAWSEIHENQIVTASGDGSIKLWDIMINDRPIRAWHEHTREVFSVDWSNIKKDVFMSSSWDGTIKLWTPDRPHSIQTVPAHATCVYQALFSPHQPDVVGTCSTDGTLKIFDLRAPSSLPHPSAPALTIPAHGTEILSLDWNKYRPFVLASASVDKLIKVWDCRMVKLGGASAGQPEVGGICEIEFRGHEYAVRKVQWSPHRPNLLASASYDMTCRVWTTDPPNHLLHIHDKHTEFVMSCAWSLYDEGVLASSSWDSRTHVFRL